MKLNILLLSLFLCSTQSWGKSLELPYIQPSPTKAFMWSTIVPGGGYFYLGQNCDNRQYLNRSFMYFAAEVAIIALGIQQIQKDPSNSIIPFAALTVGIKIFEFNSTIDTAEKEHNKNLSDAIAFKIKMQEAKQ